MIIVGGLTRLTNSGLSITEWQYSKKNNSQQQLWERFDNKTKCRQKGCEWPRGTNTCKTYEKFSKNYSELIISGNTYKNMNYYSGLLKKHSQIEINIKTATDSEKELITIGKDKEIYTETN